MYQELLRTCTAIVLLIKPFVVVFFNSLLINLDVKLSSFLQNTVAMITALSAKSSVSRTSVRDMQVTTRYFIEPGKYSENLRVLRATLFRAR